jgi:hypothetical protein
MLAVHPLTAVFWKQGRVKVDDPPRVFADNITLKDRQKPRQNDKADTPLFSCFKDTIRKLLPPFRFRYIPARRFHQSRYASSPGPLKGVHPRSVGHHQGDNAPYETPRVFRIQKRL